MNEETMMPETEQRETEQIDKEQEEEQEYTLHAQIERGQDVSRAYLERVLSCMHIGVPGVQEQLQVFCGEHTPILTIRGGTKDLYGRMMLVQACDTKGRPVLAWHPPYSVQKGIYPVMNQLAIALGAVYIDPKNKETCHIYTLMPARPGQALPSIDVFSTIQASDGEQMLLTPGIPYSTRRPRGTYSTFGASGAADGKAPAAFKSAGIKVAQKALSRAWPKGQLEEKLQEVLQWN